MKNWFARDLPEMMNGKSTVRVALFVKSAGYMLLDSFHQWTITPPKQMSMPIWSGMLGLGLDKICFAKFEQNGQPKERSNSTSKMGCRFCQK